MLMCLEAKRCRGLRPRKRYQNPLPNYRLFMREKNQLDDNFYQLNSLQDAFSKVKISLLIDDDYRNSFFKNRPVSLPFS
jgi:hypothetical protein